MSKRFTATEKWEDSWFRKLSPKMKLFFFYATEKCDAAGVIDADMEMARFFIGDVYQIEEILSAFDGRIVMLGDDKLFVTKFISFQYGELKGECKPHKNVFSLIEKHGIGEGVSKGYPKGIHTLKDKDKEKRS